MAGAAWLGSVFQSCSSCLWGSCLSGVYSAPVAAGPLCPVQILKALDAGDGKGQTREADEAGYRMSSFKCLQGTQEDSQPVLLWVVVFPPHWRVILHVFFFTCISFSHTKEVWKALISF